MSIIRLSRIEIEIRIVSYGTASDSERDKSSTFERGTSLLELCLRVASLTPSLRSRFCIFRPLEARLRRSWAVGSQLALAALVHPGTTAAAPRLVGVSDSTLASSINLNLERRRALRVIRFVPIRNVHAIKPI